jgi:nucleoside-diphosphate-sugar epimerase
MASGKRVLISGINGFTGRYVARELQMHGWDVWGFGSGAGPEGLAHFKRADILNAEEIRALISYVKPDAVVHLAGVASPAHADVDKLYGVNLLGTRHLLSAVSESTHSVECVLLASSAYVYGNATAGVFNEMSLPQPGNDYAVSKLAMEYMAKLWMDKLPIVLVRPFNYTGVGQSESFLLSKIVGHFRRKEPVIELGNLDVSRDFSDVRAVATVYRRLLEVCPLGETVNICSGEATSLRSILELAKQISGHSIEIKVNPAFVRSNDVKELLGDPVKLKSIIGPLDAPALPETLRWMIESDWPH